MSGMMDVDGRSMTNMGGGSMTSLRGSLALARTSRAEPLARLARPTACSGPPAGAGAHCTRLLTSRMSRGLHQKKTTAAISAIPMASHNSPRGSYSAAEERLQRDVWKAIRRRSASKGNTVLRSHKSDRAEEGGASSHVAPPEPLAGEGGASSHAASPEEHAGRTLSPRDSPHVRWCKTKGTPPAAEIDEQQAEVDKLKGEVAELNAKVDELQGEVHKLTGRFAWVMNEFIAQRPPHVSIPEGLE